MVDSSLRQAEMMYMLFATIREKHGPIDRRQRGANCEPGSPDPWRAMPAWQHGRVAQTVVSGQLRWYRSFSCRHCGHREEDGAGLPPAALRDLLLKAGGRWKLVVIEAKRAAAIKVMRSAMGLLMEEPAATTFRRFPAVYVGTRTELEWLKAHMDASKVASQILAEQTEHTAAGGAT